MDEKDNTVKYGKYIMMLFIKNFFSLIPFKHLKSAVYSLKESYKALFQYPKGSISVESLDNYDMYWLDKRGASVGSLSEWQRNRADYIASILASQNDTAAAVGDIGCGDGSILTYIHSILPKISCVGYDKSQLALDKAQKLGIETHYLDISHKESYETIVETDYYLLLEVLEHIPHSESLLILAQNKSRKGTFFSVPNTGYIRHRMRLLFGRFPLQWRVSPGEHVRFWTYRDLKWWLEALKMKRYEIYCYQGIPFLNRVLPSLFAAGFVIYIKKQDASKQLLSNF